jgi:ribosomal protein S18 acetylase RimI-like enzyme
MLARLRVRRASGRAELEWCARLMAGSEPWLTLGRGYAFGLKLLQDRSREVYVAVDGRRPVGFIVVAMQGSFKGYIQIVAVDAAERGRGVGGALMDFAEKRILAETPNVFICVSSFNPGARRLYESRGFRLVGELTDFVVAGHSELLLRKTTGPLNSFKPKRKSR